MVNAGTSCITGVASCAESRLRMDTGGDAGSGAEAAAATEGTLTLLLPKRDANGLVMREVVVVLLVEAILVPGLGGSGGLGCAWLRGGRGREGE